MKMKLFERIQANLNGERADMLIALISSIISFANRILDAIERRKKAKKAKQEPDDEADNAQAFEDSQEHIQSA